MHAASGIPMPPAPPEFHRLQRLHPGPHRSLRPQNLCLGKCPYRAVGNFLFEVILIPWKLDIHFPEASSSGRALWTRKVWPLEGQWTRSSQADPADSPLWFSGPKKKLQLLEMLPRDLEIKEVDALQKASYPDWRC